MKKAIFWSSVPTLNGERFNDFIAAVADQRKQEG
jgi:hypothetical protein